MLRIIATLSFFTRLPFWRLADVPKECYERVVPLWPLAGWVTGLSMGISFAIFSQLLDNPFIGIVAAMLTRVLITGALHEDGFADFCDGFGGGTTRERTLEIMKDSHIGTYGVLGLLFYMIIMPNVICNAYHSILYSLARPQDFLSLTPGDISQMVENLAPSNIKWTIFSRMTSLFIIADVMSKAVSSTIINALPYARKESEAKNKLVYAKTSFEDKVHTLFASFVPCAILTGIFLPNIAMSLCFGLMAAIIMRFLLVWFMRKKIQGYTGDCCGAMFILCEASFYIVFLAHVYHP